MAQRCVTSRTSQRARTSPDDLAPTPCRLRAMPGSIASGATLESRSAELLTHDVFIPAAAMI